MEELASASVIHPGDSGSNIGINRKYFLSVAFELKSIGWFLEHYLLIYMLDPTRHAAKNTYHNLNVERDHLRCDFKLYEFNSKCLI